MLFFIVIVAVNKKALSFSEVYFYKLETGSYNDLSKHIDILSYLPLAQFL